MKVFKCKSSENIEHTMDIILSNRLYCAIPSKLNDPMEGVILSMYEPRSKDHVDSIDETMETMERLAAQRVGVEKAASKLRVCCLSKSMANRLMWAHYANGFRGLAIELDIPSSDIREITYEADPAILPSPNDAVPSGFAEHVLSVKMEAWAYEQEARIIQRQTYYNLPKAHERDIKVIIGERMSEPLQTLVKSICRPRGIFVDMTFIRSRDVESRRIG